MKKIVKDNKTYNIDCEDNMCGNCNFKPEPLMMKCKLFDIILDHIRGGYPSNSGWKRRSECINAEVKK
jgi:hypothetical protein